MGSQADEPLAGAILDEDSVMSLAEVCRVCGVNAELITEMVEYGIVEPKRDDTDPWQFSGACITRVTTVVRLQRDLGVNLAGAALAVELMDRLQALKRRLQAG